VIPEQRRGLLADAQIGFSVNGQSNLSGAWRVDRIAEDGKAARVVRRQA
jgi:hypothetical protein